jgi:uncharacterized protein YifN (PemK superfamily)
LINLTRKARISLKKLYNARSLSGTAPIDVKRAKDYIEWIETKTNTVTNEKSFVVPDHIMIVQGMKILRATDFPRKTLVQRGSILWMDFGENIGQEFSGRHPGLILKIGGETAIVVPLSSQTPTTEQQASGIYAQVDHVYNFTPMTRWANALNTTALSIQRFHFNTVGSVKGTILDKVKIAMKASKVFGT